MMIVLLLVVLVNSQPTNSDYNETNDVINDITPEYYLNIQNTPTKHVTLFYLPRCGWCKQMRGWLNQMSREIKEQINWVGINCEDNKEFCRKQQIHRYPTIIVQKRFKKSKCFDYKYELIQKFIEKYN